MLAPAVPAEKLNLVLVSQITGYPYTMVGDPAATEVRPHQRLHQLPRAHLSLPRHGRSERTPQLRISMQEGTGYRPLLREDPAGPRLRPLSQATPTLS